MPPFNQVNYVSSCDVFKKTKQTKQKKKTIATIFAMCTDSCFEFKPQDEVVEMLREVEVLRNHAVICS